MSSATLAQIEALLDDLEREEQLRLIERIAQRLRQQEERSRVHSEPLYGFLKGKEPPGFDLDQALREIRSEWLKELDDPTA